MNIFYIRKEVGVAVDENLPVRGIWLAERGGIDY